ncbi:MAG: Hsp20/alpha crystallin family protein [Minisyncoccia bacterium]|jgi:HSP20 family protein
MIMDVQDEKFFETLAGAKSDADARYEVELAKADASVLAARPKTARPKPEPANEPEGQLTVDVYQTPSEIVVESAIAGVKPEDIDVSATPDSITIRGTRERVQSAESEDYLYQECYWGRFTRSIILPQEVDPEGASVNFKNGILTVHLPKVNKKKSKKLNVKAE